MLPRIAGHVNSALVHGAAIEAVRTLQRFSHVCSSSDCCTGVSSEAACEEEATTRLTAISEDAFRSGYGGIVAGELGRSVSL